MERRMAKDPGRARIADTAKRREQREKTPMPAIAVIEAERGCALNIAAAPPTEEDAEADPPPRCDFGDAEADWDSADSE
jgi:hypothetical protein